MTLLTARWLVQYEAVAGRQEADLGALARVVKARREELGRSQEEVARCAGTLRVIVNGQAQDVGISRPTVSTIERQTRGAKRGHGRATIVLLARGLDMEPDELLKMAGHPARLNDKRVEGWTFAEFVGQDRSLDEEGRRLLVYLYGKIRQR